MTTIPSFAAGSFVTNRTTTNLVNLKSQLDGLSTQLSTGRAAETYGGLGAGRSTSLSAHATLSALDGYDATITGAQTRVQLATASLTQLTSLTTTLRRSIDNTALNNGATADNNALLASNSLDSALDALNQQSAGQYLFGGRVLDTPPVVSGDVLLNGTTTPKADGLKALVQEQLDADLGPSGTGRLTVTTPNATTISVAEETNALTRQDFGFQFTGAPTATGSAISVSAQASAPSTTYDIGLSAQPAIGDSLTFTLSLKGGGTTTLTLTAQSQVTPGSHTGFAIGANAAETAANLSNAVTGALKDAANTTLAAKSITDATTRFFDGGERIGNDSAGNPVFISQLSPSDAALPGNQKSTVQWYRGEASTTDPRAATTVRIGATNTVEIGARANEDAIKDALKSLAAAAVNTVGTTPDTSAARWKAVAARTTTLLPATGALESITADFSLGASALSNAQTQNKSTRATLQSAVDGVETVTTEEVAAKLLAVQNQLQASYQVTSMLSKLSLVNYLN
jgi:flagellar hook-associated protein 3 FlgL